MVDIDVLGDREIASDDGDGDFFRFYFRLAEIWRTIMTILDS